MCLLQDLGLNFFYYNNVSPMAQSVKAYNWLNRRRAVECWIDPHTQKFLEPVYSTKIKNKK